MTDSYGEAFSMGPSFTIQVTNLFNAIITTNAIEEQEDGTFLATGSILHDGGADILSKGMVYGTSPGLSLTAQGAGTTSSSSTGNTIETTLSGLTLAAPTTTVPTKTAKARPTGASSNLRPPKPACPTSGRSHQPGRQLVCPLRIWRILSPRCQLDFAPRPWLDLHCGG